MSRYGEQHENASHHLAGTHPRLFVTARSLRRTSAGARDDQSRVTERNFAVERTETIAAVHEDNRDEIQTCFEKTADDDDKEKTYAEVELRLPASGEPASIRLIEPEEHSDELNDCIESIFVDLNYGEAQRGATFYQMFRFDPQRKKLEFHEPVDAFQRWGLTGDEIDEVVHAEKEAINACYDEADEPGDGEVTVEIAIDDTGTVSRATPERSSLDDDAVGNCLTEVLIELDFPEPRGGGIVVVDYPFPFEEGKGWLERKVPGK
ncbi:MAG: AgmX/PglI C-terminal domain-containing protein [Persicimonas sp.]